MSYIWTYGGGQISITDPKPDQFDPEMIATNLARKSRWNDHGKGHYSVAEHSVRVADMVPPAFRLEGLVHDVDEVVLNDIASPVIKLLGPEFGKIKRGIQIAIGKRYGVELVPMPAVVRMADKAMVVAEAATVMGVPEEQVKEHFGVNQVPAYEPHYWNEHEAKAEFLGRLLEWTK